MLRSHVVFAVFRRNFWSYFSGVIGYLFIVAFVLAGALLAFREEFFTSNLANLDKLNEYFPQLLLFIIPAITMGAWAEEKKIGTDELLFTLPVSDLEVLLGKYLSVVAVYSVVLLFSLTDCLVLGWIGDPDWGLIAATYLGYWLSGCALLAIGLVASFLTNSSTVSFVLAIVLCAIPVYIRYLPMPVFLSNIVGHDRLFEQLSIPYHFQQFGRGFFPMTSLFYFLSLILFALYVNLVLIGQRHWAGGKQQMPMGWQYVVRAICLALILVSGNAVAANIRWQPDLTAERLYTLTPTTRKLLRELTDKRPVTIQAFVSKDVPREYVATRTMLLGMLSQYQAAGRGNIVVRPVEISPFSEEAEEARTYGIEPRKIQSERGGRVQVDDVFLGCVVSSGASEVVVPFFDTALPIEYELTRSVRTVAKEKRLKVGILETDAKIGGGFDMNTFRSSPEWRIVTELKKQYDVENISPATPIEEGKVDVLIAIMPSSLTQEQMANLVNYVRKGNPTLIFDDPLPAFDPGMAPRQPKPRAGGMMGQGAPPEQKADGGAATSLVNLLGIQWIYDQIVWADTVMVLHPEFADVVRPEMVAISPKSGLASAFNPDQEISSGLQELLLFFSGTILPREGSKLKFEPLLRTGKSSGLLNWDEFIEPGMFGGVSIKENPIRHVDEDAHVCAAYIHSDDKAGDKADGDKIKVVYVADSDVISDWFFMVRERRMYGLDLDNVNFVLNAVDFLAGDDAYIALRKRRPKHRTLTAVEQATSDFIKDSAKEREKAAKTADESLEEAKARFKEKVEKIQKDDTLDDLAKMQQLAIAQSEESRRVEVEEARIEQRKEKEIDQIRNRTERKVREIEQWYFLLATLIPPVPALVLGLAVWMHRLKDEQRDIQPARRRKS